MARIPDEVIEDTPSARITQSITVPPTWHAPMQWNNLSRSLKDITRGVAGEHYLGCHEQADALQRLLKRQKYDDKWTFTRMGSNRPQVDYDGNPRISHWWLVAKSSNPIDPTLVLDP